MNAKVTNVAKKTSIIRILECTNKVNSSDIKVIERIGIILPPKIVLASRKVAKTIKVPKITEGIRHPQGLLPNNFIDSAIIFLARRGCSFERSGMPRIVLSSVGKKKVFSSK